MIWTGVFFLFVAIFFELWPYVILWQNKKPNMGMIPAYYFAYKTSTFKHLCYLTFLIFILYWVFLRII